MPPGLHGCPDRLPREDGALGVLDPTGHEGPQPAEPSSLEDHDAQARAELTRKFYSGETSLEQEYASQPSPPET